MSKEERIQEQWTRVEDGLPMVNLPVLIWWESGHSVEMACRYYDGNTEIFQLERTHPQDESIIFAIADGQITHWQNLPSAPGQAEAKLEPQTVAEPIDGKFGWLNGQIVNLVSGEAIPKDEPLFLLRGRDHVAYNAITAYLGECEESGCNELHLAGIGQARDRFAQFAIDHPERMKQPGITRHLKLSPVPDTKLLVDALEEVVEQTRHRGGDTCRTASSALTSYREKRK